MSDNTNKDSMKQDALWYSFAGNNELGEPTVNPRVAIKCRVEEEVQDDMSPTSNLLEEDHMIKVDREISVGDIIWVGEDPGGNPSSDFLKVVNYEEDPDVKGKKYDRWVRVSFYGNELPEIV